MKIYLKIVISILCILISVVSLAQINTKTTTTLFANNKHRFTLYDTTNLLSKQELFKNKEGIKPFNNRVYYPAFFCRMENKIASHYGINIKIHAGDYDTYTKISR